MAIPLPQEIKKILRVNQAGEYGARRIYQGQLAVIKDDEMRTKIQHMAAQEEAHLATFNQLIIEYGVTPTLLQPLWHVGGYAMGAITAWLGKDTAYACTVAVEEVIDEHYAQQLDYLRRSPEDNRDLIQIIQKFQNDEFEHKQIALAAGAENAPAYKTLTNVIKGITKLAIKASKKI